jgi:hypothetical protein
MRRIACAVMIALMIWAPAAAGELKAIHLVDGSVVTGRIEAFADGVWTIRSDSLGTLHIDESRVSAIRPVETAPESSAAPVANAPVDQQQVRGLQQKMLSDDAVADLLTQLQNDPQVQKVLNDPALMQAIQAGDLNTLLSSPDFMKLLENAGVRDIAKALEK